MKDCHNHYLMTDILLLADVFENFRKMSLETYGLDPIHYYSLPGLSWELVVITDPDMHIMEVLVTFATGMLPRIIPAWIRVMRMKSLGR